MICLKTYQIPYPLSGCGRRETRRAFVARLGVGRGWSKRNNTRRALVACLDVGGGRHNTRQALVARLGAGRGRSGINDGQRRGRGGLTGTYLVARFFSLLRL